MLLFYSRGDWTNRGFVLPQGRASLRQVPEWDLPQGMSYTPG